MIDMFDELKPLRMAEIRARLTQRGAGWKPSEKKDELIQRLVELSVSTQPDNKVDENDDEQDTMERPAARKLSQDEVMGALSQHAANGLRVLFSPDGTCWGVCFGNKSDSGNMSIPISVIKRCADRVMK